MDAYGAQVLDLTCLPSSLRIVTPFPPAFSLTCCASELDAHGAGASPDVQQALLPAAGATAGAERGGGGHAGGVSWESAILRRDTGVFPLVCSDLSLEGGA